MTVNIKKYFTFLGCWHHNSKRPRKISSLEKSCHNGIKRSQCILNIMYSKFRYNFYIFSVYLYSADSSCFASHKQKIVISCSHHIINIRHTYFFSIQHITTFVVFITENTK